jgi:hypothetical protein
VGRAIPITIFVNIVKWLPSNKRRRVDDGMEDNQPMPRPKLRLKISSTRHDTITPISRLFKYDNRTKIKKPVRKFSYNTRSHVSEVKALRKENERLLGRFHNLKILFGSQETEIGTLWRCIDDSRSKELNYSEIFDDIFEIIRDNDDLMRSYRVIERCKDILKKGPDERTYNWTF